MHWNGAIKDHFQQTHDITLTRNIIVDCTKIMRQESDIIRLQIAKAVIRWNRQDTGKTRTLKLYIWLFGWIIMCDYLYSKSNVLLIVIICQHSGYSGSGFKI